MEPKFSKNVYGSITDKKLAKAECFGRYFSSRIGNRSVIELCCGLGVQLIQIAKKTDKHTIGIDSSPERIASATKNAKLYEVENIQFINGDVLDTRLLSSMAAEVVIIDPHWSLSRTLQSDFATRLEDTSPPASVLTNLARKHISSNIILQLPSTISNKELVGLGDCEIQDVYVNGTLKQKAVYYGDLKNKEVSEIRFNFVKGIVPEGLKKKEV